MVQDSEAEGIELLGYQLRRLFTSTCHAFRLKRLWQGEGQEESNVLKHTCGLEGVIICDKSVDLNKLISLDRQADAWGGMSAAWYMIPYQSGVVAKNSGSFPCKHGAR